VEALEIPDHDRTQRIVEHARADFELPLDNEGIRGGQMASEVDVGFEIQV
jgi:hypothetical protein